MRSIILGALALFAAAPVLAQSAPPSLPQLRSADGKHLVRATPIQAIDDAGNLIDLRGPIAGPTTSSAVSFTQADTYQSVLTASGARLGCLVQNKSATAVIRIFLGAPGGATAARSIDVQPGDTFSCTSAAGVVVTDQISAAATIAPATALVVSQ